VTRPRALVAVLVVGLVATAAWAEPRSTTRDGKTLTVSKATRLAVDGEQVTVTGKGYDESKGVYVAFCVDNGPGQVPTPCGGGADTEGSSGNSVWVSSFPPAYGSGLAQPYGEGGSFEVTINVRAQLDEETDCRVVRCAVVTRNDHTRSDDRSQDVLVPVTFGAATTAPPRATARPTARASAPGGAPGTAPGAAPDDAATAGAPGAAAGTTGSPAPASSAPGSSGSVSTPSASAPALSFGGGSTTEALGAGSTDDGAVPLVAVLGALLALGVSGALVARLALARRP
jgi:hypothetical protein